MMMSEWDIMIKFEGNIDKNIEKYIIKKGRKFSTVISLGVTIILCSLSLLVGVAVEFEKTFYICFSVFLFGGIAIMIYDNLPCANINYTSDISTKIIIEEEYIAAYKRCGVYRQRDLFDIKKIIDYGDFYEICFYLPWDQGFICQKDLIVEGTIEEFEELFADKLVRKETKKSG